MSTCPERVRGATLIELIVTIVIISVALAGVLLAINRATRVSVQPMVQAQAVTIAESYLDEILLRAYRDPDGDGGCAAPGAEAGEGRGSYDDVNDYHGVETDGRVRNQFGELLGELAGYRVQVTVSCTALGSITAASGEAARVRVAVSNTALVAPVVLHGYRAEAP